MWDKQNQHVGDRQRLFTAVDQAVDATKVLYPGSYVDLAASFVWPAVTYVDLDRRAAQFFADENGIQQLISEQGIDPSTGEVRFIRADYTSELDLRDDEFDLLISLYAGFVSEHCTDHLRVGGTLLANPSHGDVAMASIDFRYRLRAVITARSDRYSVTSQNLDSYLVPRRSVDLTRQSLHASGRGIAYEKSAFAYLFERVA